MLLLLHVLEFSKLKTVPFYHGGCANQIVPRRAQRLVAALRASTQHIDSPLNIFSADRSIGLLPAGYKTDADKAMIGLSEFACQFVMQGILSRSMDLRVNGNPMNGSSIATSGELMRQRFTSHRRTCHKRSYSGPVQASS